MNPWPWVAAAGLAAVAASLRYNWWRRKVPGVPVLLYHQVTGDLKDTPLPKLKVSPQAFARQLDLLQRRGYRTVTLSQALGPHCPKDAVVLTFDDGYRDFLTNAWPLLQERGMTATVFLVTGQIGGYNAWDEYKGLPREELLGPADVRELAAQGVEFGGHGHSHCELSGLDDAELAAELHTCFEELSTLLDRPPRVLAYPFGSYDARVQEAARKAGFSAACATGPGMLQPGCDPLALDRIMIKRRDNLIDFSLKLTRARSSI